jgi:antitoxin YefM
MIALRTIDLRNDFKKVSDLVNSGEKILISRPRNKNLVVLSESEYNKLEKAQRNTMYYSMIDESVLQVAEGKSISFTIDELDAMESMSSDELQSYVVNKRKGTAR